MPDGHFRALILMVKYRLPCGDYVTRASAGCASRQNTSNLAAVYVVPVCTHGVDEIVPLFGIFFFFKI